MVLARRPSSRIRRHAGRGVRRRRLTVRTDGLHTEELQRHVYQRTAELATANAALLDNERRFHVLFDQASDGMMLADGETRRLALANRRMQLMLGYWKTNSS